MGYQVTTLCTALIVGWQRCESAYCTKCRPIVITYFMY